MLHAAAGLHALVGGVVHILVLGAGGNTLGSIRVQYYKIAVAAHRQSPFPRVHPEELGGALRQNLHELMGAHTPRGHARRIKQHGAVLHTGDAVGDLGKILPSQLLGTVEIKGDTTGAGDTFTGYFLACILRNMQIKDCLQYASRAAAIAVTRKGAASAIPWKEEVDEYEEKIAL